MNEDRAAVGERPRLRIDTVFVPVRDVAAATGWYRRVLGWELAWSNESAACFRAEGTPLTLLRYGYPGRAPEERFVPLEQVCFNFYTEHLGLLHGWLERAGVRVEPICDYGPMQDFRFYDPDGNVLCAVSW